MDLTSFQVLGVWLFGVGVGVTIDAAYVRWVAAPGPRAPGGQNEFERRAGG